MDDPARKWWLPWHWTPFEWCLAAVYGLFACVFAWVALIDWIRGGV